MGASTTETLLLQVDIQANNTRLVELQKQLLDAKAANAALNDSFKQGKITADELATEQQKLKAQTAAISQEARILTKANADQQKATDAAAGSINQLRAQLALGTAAYNKLSQSERDNTDAGQKLQAGNKALSDQLKTLEKAVGDTRRNVGNYKEDVVGALRETNLFGVNIGQTADNLKGGLTQGLDIAKKGFGSLKAAVASTGIGLLVLAFVSLFEYFKKTDEGAELLEAAFAGVGAVVNTLNGVVIGFGKALVSAASDPKKALSDLVDFLETNVANRFKAFGVVIDAIKTGNLKGLANGVIQMTSGIEDGIGKAQKLGDQFGAIASEAKRAAGAAFELKQAQFALEDARRQSVVTLEKERNQVDKLVLSARDRALSEKQRLANLDEASRLETKGLQTTTALATEKLRIIQAQNREAILTGKISDEQRDADAQAQAEVVRLAGQSATLQQQIANRRATVLEQAAADAKADAAAELERQRDVVRARQTSLELQLLAVQKGSAAELVIKQKQLEAARDLELIAEKQTADQKKLIRAKADVDIQNLAEEFNEKQLEIAKKRTEAQNKEVLREYSEAQKNLNDYLASKQAQVESDYAKGLISENEYQAKLNAIEKAGNDAALVNAKDYAQDQGAILKKQSDNEIKENNRVKNERKKIEEAKRDIIDATLQAGITASDLAVQALGEETTAGQVALAIKKTLALAEIAIGLEKQLAANAVAGAKISAEAPPVTIPLGIAYTVATDVLAVAGAAASAAKILGFNTGGIVPGVGNTDSVPAILTPGEIVMNKAASEQFAPVLSYLNTLAGGASFAPSIAPRMNGQVDGGLMARTLGNSAFPSAAEIGAAVAQNVPTSIAVDEINRATNRKVRARAITRLS